VVYALLLHKKVMALATINSGATTKTLCSNLREILMYCTTIKGNVNLLHSYFDNNYSQIITRGATVDNPVDILFTAILSGPVRSLLIVRQRQTQRLHQRYGHLHP
jgi:hypothetical protein